jgi:hypothetical protein
MRRECLAALLVSCAAALPSSVNAGACERLSGTYSFQGDIEGTKRSVDFLDLHSRPSRSGVHRFRLSIDVSNGQVLRASFLDANGSAVGPAVEIAGTCIEDVWVSSHSYDGSSDGTLVSGKRTWRHLRDADGGLMVEHSYSYTAHYFLGMFPKSRAGAIVVRFPSTTD